MHYTASGGFGSTRNWLCDPKAKVSAHYLIGRAGEYAQLVPLDKCAWHAGESEWKTYKGLNKYSFGIELVSWGPLERRADGKYYAVFGGKEVPAEEVHVGGPGLGSYRYWQNFTKPQLLCLADLIAMLRKTYPSIEEIVGHSDIAGKRGKMDPWPLDAKTLSQPT